MAPKVLALGALLATTAVAGAASAQERLWHLGGSLGFAHLWGGPTSPGFGGGVHGAYGLNDLFNLVAAFDVSAHPSSRWTVLSGGVGATYLMDIGTVVPYGGAMIGPAGLVSVNPNCGASTAEPCRAFRLNLEVPFGIDYVVTKRLSVGAGGRLQVLLLGAHPWLSLGIVARAEVVWGR
jgi:hypothetical protein